MVCMACRVQKIADIMPNTRDFQNHIQVDHNRWTVSSISPEKLIQNNLRWIDRIRLSNQKQLKSVDFPMRTMERWISWRKKKWRQNLIWRHCRHKPEPISQTIQFVSPESCTQSHSHRNNTSKGKLTRDASKIVFVFLLLLRSAVAFWMHSRSQSQCNTFSHGRPRRFKI